MSENMITIPVKYLEELIQDKYKEQPAPTKIPIPEPIYAIYNQNDGVIQDTHKFMYADENLFYFDMIDDGFLQFNIVFQGGFLQGDFTINGGKYNPGLMCANYPPDSYSTITHTLVPARKGDQVKLVINKGSIYGLEVTLVTNKGNNPTEPKVKNLNDRFRR